MSVRQIDPEVLARIGLALADDSRRRMLIALVDRPRYPAELADSLGMTRANVSNHLACLRGCGLVVAEPEGRRVKYELVDARLGSLLRDLSTIIVSPNPALCPTSENGCC